MIAAPPPFQECRRSWRRINGTTNNKKSSRNGCPVYTQKPRESVMAQEKF